MLAQVTPTLLPNCKLWDLKRERLLIGHDASFSWQSSSQGFGTQRHMSDLSNTTGRECLHLQGLQFSSELMDTFSEHNLADLAGNA